MPLGAFRLNSLARYIAPTGAATRDYVWIGRQGSTKILVNQYKFGSSSGYFDGTNDRLELYDDFSTSGNFTFECWFRPQRVTGTQTLFAIGDQSSGSYNLYLNGNVPALRAYGSGSDAILNGTVYVNTWHHIALVRSGTSVTIYLDGTSLGSATISGTFGNANYIHMGCLSDNTYDYQGWIDEFRASSTARYTGSFTPSSTAFTNDADTTMLMHFEADDNTYYTFFDDNGTDLQFFDVPTSAFSSDASTINLYHFENNGNDSSGNGYNFTTTGGFTSSEKKFGTYSGNLTDSTSDYFTRNINGYFGPWNGSAYTDWCAEGWFNYQSWNGATQSSWTPNAIMIGDQGGNNVPIWMGFNGETPQGKLCMYNYGVFSARGSDTFDLNTWHHIAFVFDATTKMYMGFCNGKLQFNSPKGMNPTQSQSYFTVGGANVGNSNCYVDEVRVSRSKRYI